MQETTITLVCIAKHKAVEYTHMIDSVADWVNRIVTVVDEDAEPGIYGYRPEVVDYFRRPLAMNFAEQRNFACSQVKEGWIVHVDTDENLSVPLLRSLRVLALCECDIFEIPRRNTLIMPDGTVRDWISWPDWQPKLHRVGIKWQHPVHEWPDMTGRKVVRLGPDRSYCMVHVKTEEDQQRVNQFYDKFEYHHIVCANRNDDSVSS